MWSGTKGRVFVILAFSCLLVWGWFLATPVLPAADTWWHLACGKFLCEQATWSNISSGVLSDPYSFGSDLGRWLNHEWASEMIFYRLYTLGGSNGLFFTRSILVISSFIILPVLFARYCGLGLVRIISHPIGDYFSVFTILLVTFCCAEPNSFFDVRAYLFTYLGLALTLFIVLAILRQASLYWLAVLSFLELAWSNLHGGFIVGIGILFAVSISLCFVDRNERRLRSRACAFGLCALASLALVCLFSPFGTDILLYPFSLVESLAQAQGEANVFSLGLNEWGAPNLYRSYNVWLLYFLSLVVWRKSRWPQRVLLLCFLLAMTFTWRHAPLGALACSFIFLDTFFAPKSQLNAERDVIVCSAKSVKGYSLNLWQYSSFVEAVMLAGVTAGLLCGAVGLSLRLPGGATRWSMETRLFPQAGVEFLNNNPNLPQQLFNPYEWGGYLAWRSRAGRKIFIDGRANTLYSEPRYAKALFLQYGSRWRQVLRQAGQESVLTEQPNFIHSDTGRIKNLDKISKAGSISDNELCQQILTEYGIDLLMASKLQGNLVRRMTKLPGWLCIYEDPICVLYLRDTPQHRALAARLVYLPNAWSVAGTLRHYLQTGQLSSAQSLLQQYPELLAGYSELQYYAGWIELSEGKKGDAVIRLLYALLLDPKQRGCNLVLGSLAQQAGWDTLARYLWRQEKRLDPDNVQLEELLKTYQ